MRKHLWCRLWRARDGLGAVEMGFIAPVLLLLLLGILDFGMAFWQQMEIGNAADAGAQWAMTNTFDVTKITNIATHATNLSAVQADPPPTQICGCPTSTGVTQSGAYPTCGTCSDGTTAKPYVVVNTKICYRTIFRWPIFDITPNKVYGNLGCDDSNNEIPLTAQSLVLQ